MDELEDIFGEDTVLDNPGDITPVITGQDDDDVLIFDEPKDGATSTENPLLTELLKSKGISDSKIVLVDENDVEKEVNFFELTLEQQLEILSAEEGGAAPVDLQDSEQELIKYLRDNNLTVDQYLEAYKEQIVEELSSNVDPSYDIDAYTDEELFVLDLKAKYDLTDDECVKELEKELQDKELFNKKVTKLRSEYKELEDSYKEQQEQLFNSQREAEYNDFVDKMVGVAVETSDLYGFELDDDEKDVVLDYLLALDESGNSNFYKALEDPKNLYRAAWFLSFGEQAFEALKNAYEAEISTLKKDIGKKIVVKQDKKINSIHDLN